ncbi:NERD domain-containing protein [Polycladidibacter hongkongensis]|uniref:NERD domain-containing protein n=1 Tax=Polycladidibacter hongkongensis TaxID=1647556 RepID=UPI00082D8497|nr:NERD domain-containing protein [Pseudovibrio hongkongensis]
MPAFTFASSLKKFTSLAQPYANQVNLDPIPKEASDATVIQTAQNAIKTALASDADGFPSSYLFRIRKSMEIALYLEEAQVETWYLLYAIFDSLTGVEKCQHFENAGAWRCALDNATLLINNHWFRHELIEGSREEAIAGTVRSLRSKGFRMNVDGTGIKIAPSELKRLCVRLEKKIHKVGGVQAANILLAYMGEIGHIKDGSLIHARRPTQPSNLHGGPSLPWHFIYSLCLKNARIPARSSASKNDIQSIEELGRLIASVVDVEPYSAFEYLNLDGALFSQALHETLVYDEMFAFPQWQPLTSPDLFADWFRALENVGCRLPIVNADGWTELSKCLLSLSSESALFPVTRSKIRTESLSHEETTKLLDVMCSPSVDLNRSYLRPHDTKHRDATYFPVLMGPRGEALLQPKGPLGRAICERAYALMRESNIPRLENKMGAALEHVTASALRDSGSPVSVVNGCYPNPDGGTDLEIDIAVETEERIFLFECKKKVLTNKSRQGDALSALADLDGSFLHFTMQLARHEAALRTQETLHFRNGQKLSLSGRSIEKIGISLFDHGSMQHRDMVISLLELFIGRQLTIDDPKAQKLCSSFNSKLDGLSVSLRKIIDAQSGKDADLIFSFAMSTWWLSIDQLKYAMLKGKGLWVGLERVRHLTQRSGDLIYDICTLNNLNEVGEAMLEVSKQMDNRSLI